MPILLTPQWWAAQPEATDTTVGIAGGTPSRPPSPGCGGGGSQFILVGLMFALFYFLLIRPQQKRQSETDEMLRSLRKGDKVRTTGGIRGEIVDLDDQEVALLVAEKVKLHVLRSHIASRIEKPAADAGAKDAKGK